MEKLIARAKAIAFVEHEGHVDKAGADYYTGHIKAVVGGVNTDEERVVAYLHDVVEDTDVTLDELADRLDPDNEYEDVVERIIAGVDAVTKRKHEKTDRYGEYLERVKANDLARAVKLADYAHNTDLTRLETVTDTDLKRNEKYRKGIEYLLN